MAMQKIYLRMVALFLLGIALGWAGATVMRNLEKEQVDVPVVTGQEKSAAIKTYRNERLGISFQYPSDWEVIDQHIEGNERGLVVRLQGPVPEGVPGLDPYSYDVELSHWTDMGVAYARGGDAPGDDGSVKELREFMEGNKGFFKKRIGRTVVGGVDAYEVTINGIASNYGVMLEKNGIYELSFTTIGAKDQMTPGQRLVLESFTFLE